MKRVSQENKTSRIVIYVTLTLVFLSVTSLYYFPLFGTYIPIIPYRSSSLVLPSPSAPPPVNYVDVDDPIESANAEQKCDLFKGEWVPNPNAPYYTNDTCWAIHDNQNCRKFGRPDEDFTKWRWKPNDCTLPTFNPAQFLEIVRGKSLAFVGDSVGRNQMQSLMCLLNRVTYAVDVSSSADEKSRRWSYPSHNFTLANFWSPYLVTAQEVDPKGPTLTGLFKLNLDEADPSWTTRIEGFDYVIVSAGHWFFRPTLYYRNKDDLVGCHYCLDKNIEDLTMYYGYGMTFRTTFRALNSLSNFKGTVFLRTFVPSHFENGEWDKGGDCVRREPFRSNETRLDGFNLELYMTQLKEFRDAERAGRERGLSYKLLDMTEMMLRRPDGHPSRYGHPPKAKVTLYNDCVHWCLPGPIDTWNDFLLHILKMDGGRSRRFPQIIQNATSINS
ncbi:protein trichome birefringence-like 19 isoform X2 [Iris pallida]|uniref:Protein trichome birefringence-like 19 isoform X2 n=1 Tax=Iris pallida TaxID=29817 RepID=A0AAX6G827_IRIPA|nr:protein trichome birefringence-like 19 isoform X2 [Iris pallida]